MLMSRLWSLNTTADSKEPRILGEIIDSSLGQEMCEMSMKHFVPAARKYSKTTGVKSRDSEVKMKRLLMLSH